MTPTQSLQDFILASPRSTVSTASNHYGHTSGSRGSFASSCSWHNAVEARGYRAFVPAGTITGWSPNLQWSVTHPTTAAVNSDAGRPASQCLSQPPALEANDTTLMISNLPFQLTCIDMLIWALDQYGFAGTYDLVYIPPKQKAMRVRTDTAFCFVNFKSPEHAAWFVRQPGGFASQYSQEAPSVSRAKCQGFSENLKAHLKSCGKVDHSVSLRLFR